MDESTGKIIAEVASKSLPTLFSEAAKCLLDRIRRPKAKPVPTEPVRECRTHERRILPIDMRLRKGICVEFYRKTGLGKTELLDLSNADLRDKLIEAAVLESERYELTDRETYSQAKAAAGVTRVVELACQDWKKVPSKDRRVSTAAKCVANRLVMYFDVHQRDRRAASQGASASS